MDDKSPNSSAPQSNIDDLVKELSRPQGAPPSSTSGSVSPTTPPPISNTLPHPTPVSPAPVMPPRSMTPPSVTPNQILVSPKTSFTPVVPQAPVASSVPKEYQSSIRTMSDDIVKLKAGQQLQGVNIPRKIDNTPLPTSGSSPTISAPVPAPSKSGITSSLPLAVKSAPMSSVPSQTPKTSAPAPIPRPTMSSMPKANKASEIKPDQKNQFYVPPADIKQSASSSSKNIIFVGIAVAVVLLGGLYWYFMIPADEVVVESPTPVFTARPTATPNPDILSTIFTTRGGVISLPSAGSPVSAFNNAIAAQPNITPGTFTVIDIASGASSSAQILTISGLLNRFVASYPPALQTALGQNYKFLLYGQKESFDSKGRPVTNVAPGPRVVMVSEIASSSVSILQGWESIMSTSLSEIMAITPAKNSGSFLATSYNGVPIRFKNFLYPDRSIDYALIQYNGKTYLVIAGSREAMFATIDSFLVLGK